MAMIYAMHYVTSHVGTDYIVDTEDPQSMTFVVVFVSNRAQSTEHVILIADDAIFEGTEFFRCQIVKLDFTEGAQQLFRPQDRINSTFADVRIEDNDSKSVQEVRLYIK